MNSLPVNLCFTFLFSTVALCCSPYESVTICPVDRSNYAPVVGILAEDTYTEEDLKHGNSSIEAYYVKWAEMGGMRVVPVFLNRTEEYYRSIYRKVDGLILPGGGVIMG